MTITVYRSEGSHESPGYAGVVDSRTGRFFGSLDRAAKYLTEDRHLFEVEVAEVDGFNIDDHVLVSSEVAARKVHSPLCPNHNFMVTVDYAGHPSRGKAGRSLGAHGHMRRPSLSAALRLPTPEGSTRSPITGFPLGGGNAQGSSEPSSPVLLRAGSASNGAPS